MKMKIILAVCVMGMAGVIAAGCAEWKKDAMKEPEVSYDPVTGEPSYSKEMTLFSTDGPEVSRDPLPGLTDYERETDPLKMPPTD